ncbi:hypothetical protein ABPG73_005958 [Tetrahymena malaccensis]
MISKINEKSVTQQLNKQITNYLINQPTKKLTNKCQLPNLFLFFVKLYMLYIHPFKLQIFFFDKKFYQLELNANNSFYFNVIKISVQKYKQIFAALIIIKCEQIIMCQYLFILGVIKYQLFTCLFPIFSFYETKLINKFICSINHFQ